MKLKYKVHLVLVVLVGLLAIWLLLTLLAQRETVPHLQILGTETAHKRALVVFNPDLFYNLDEQVCTAFAKGLSENGWLVSVASVMSAQEVLHKPFDLYAFCANTYNWAPDKPTQGLIRTIEFRGKPVVAITVGSGSTARAKRILEDLTIAQGADLIGSREYWLMRPNDESISDMSNVEVASKKAFQLGLEISKGLESE